MLSQQEELAQGSQLSSTRGLPGEQKKAGMRSGT